MFRTLGPTLFVLLTVVPSLPARAELGSGLIVPAEARRYGLDRVWFTQVQLDAARARVTSLQYFVSSADTYTLHEVRYLDRRRKFSERDLDSFGEALGKEGALKAANQFIEDLKKQNVEGKLETFIIPEISLYVTTDRGVIHAIDGETGKTRWAVLLGNENHVTEKVGVSERFVAVLNGSTLYLLKRASGEIAWTRRVKGVPGAGPAITEKYVVVPTVSGTIELYDIKETRTLPEMYKSNGRVIVQPTTGTDSVAWPTDRGFLYVASANIRALRFRLEAKDAIVASAAFFPPKQFFTASIDGYVYSLDEVNGNEKWRVSAGEPVSQTPAPAGDSVYVVTDQGNLFCLNMENGIEKWTAPQIRRFVAVSKDRVYCLNNQNRLTILDAKGGSRIATMSTESMDVFYSNLLTDRIILGNKTGIIQCLREVAMEWPLVHAGLEEKKEEPKKPDDEAAEGAGADEKKPAKPVKPAKPEPKKANDPFAADGQDAKEPAAKEPAGDNPFGMDGAKPAAKEPAGENPFGMGDEKPAAKEPAGKEAPGADPFGAADEKPAAKPAAKDGGAGAEPKDPFS